MAEDRAMTRQEIESKLIAQAWQDESFKHELLSNPKTAFENEGISIPESIEIRVVEETSDCLYFVLPMQPSEELSDAELESVAGGWGPKFSIGDIGYCRKGCG